jgi:hypothetical protein
VEQQVCSRAPAPQIAEAQPMAPEWDRKEPAAIQVAGFQVISENGCAN